MQSYQYQQNQQQDNIEQYQQELGLRKMLYKYQHQNEQLKNQIKALTQRLQSILANKNNIQPQHHNNQHAQEKIQDAHTKYLNEQMKYYFKRIQQLNTEIKNYKDSIDNTKELEFVNLANTLKDKQAKLDGLRQKLEKFKVQEVNDVTNTPAINVTASKVNEQLQAKYTNQLNQIKKKIRQLEKVRNSNHKNQINRHMELVNLETRTRKINNGQLFKQEVVVEETSGPGKKGLWGLDLTQENYRKISQDFQQLKRQKGMLIESIKVQNNILRQKVAKLKNQYIDISAQTNGNQSVDISAKRLKQSAVLTPKKNLKQTIVLPDIPVALGNSAYERKNDKNFVPKKIKLIQWNINKSKKSSAGFSWNDQNNKSPITGINLWMDKILIGIQFIHTLGQTIQHIHSEGGAEIKKLVPIQYRLNSNDYLENIVVVFSKTATNVAIQGIQLYSKNGRKDVFGVKIGTQGTQKFDFDIIAPEKPIYSFGSFVINPSTHLSSINSLGFAVI